MLEKIKSKAFWQAAAERAVQTFWQAFLGSGIAITSTTDVSVVKAAAYSALISTVLSLLKSISVGLVTDGNPALGSTEILASDGATGVPLGEDEQKTVVPDPTGEIAEQVQAEVQAEAEEKEESDLADAAEGLPYAPDADVAPAPLGADVRLS